MGRIRKGRKAENPVEEKPANICVMASHDSKTMNSKGKEVMSSSSYLKYLFSMDKHKLIELLMETQEKLEENNVKCLQIEKDLKFSKDHVSYLIFFIFDAQNKFFNLLDQNTP